MSGELVVSRPFPLRLNRLAAMPVVGPATGALLLLGVVFINESNFRIADADNFSFDWQIALRLGICGLCGLYGLAHLRETAFTLLRFPVAWIVLFAAWVTLTLPFAINRSYAAGSLVSLWCVILFAPAVLKQLGGRNVVFVVLAGITVYVIGSWAVYILVPEMGQTLAINEEITPRMGGLNHANGTGMTAAWARRCWPPC